MMDAKLKEEWVKALRSGKYDQADGFLHYGSGFCCLGVLCDIQGAEWRTGIYPGQRAYLSGKSAHARNVLGVMQYVLPKAAGGLRRPQQSILAAMNDDGKSFEEIADYIEKNL